MVWRKTKDLEVLVNFYEVTQTKTGTFFTSIYVVYAVSKLTASFYSHWQFAAKRNYIYVCLCRGLCILVVIFSHTSKKQTCSSHQI